MPTRRRFLGGALTVAVLGVVAWVVSPLRDRTLRKAGHWYAYREKPDLPAAPVGPLPDGTATRLAAAGEALIGLPVERSHYEAYFDWRARNLPGYRKLYLELDERLQGSETRPGRGPWDTETLDHRREMLREIHDFWSADPSSWTVLFDRPMILARVYFRDEVLRLFEETDAWTALGYRAWPGTPRGLDAYTEIPAALTGDRG